MLGGGGKAVSWAQGEREREGKYTEKKWMEKIDGLSRDECVGGSLWMCGGDV